MPVSDLDILTVRNKGGFDVAVRIVEPFPGNWHVYRWEEGHCENWGVTLGRRFASRADALRFIEEKGYVIAQSPAGV